MSGLFRALFPRRIRAGDVFMFDDTQIPPSRRHRVIVKGVDGRWINYRWAVGQGCQDEWLSKRTFWFLYERVFAEFDR